MAVVTVHTDKGDMDLVGRDNAQLGFVTESFVYNASSVDIHFFVATRAYRVKAIIGRPRVIGSDASAVTAVLKKAPSGTAFTSGTALHSGSMNLKGTADTNQTLALSTTSADLDIAAGDTIGVDFTGTLTAATGVISIALAPR